MSKRENTLSRDRQILVDLLNFDFQKPSMWLGWFLNRYNLSHEAAKQIRDELLGVLFLYDPKGNRELGPLVVKAQKYPVKTILIALEDNKGVKLLREMAAAPREHLYQTIIEAVQDKSFPFLQQSCKNCQQYYWRRGDYCSLSCGREYNTKTARERMKRYRLKLKKKGRKK